ncbi:hypothetical protein D3C87_1310340 [compost metagenome]
MEGIVHACAALGALVVVVDGRLQRAALALRRERNHGSCSAASRRSRARMEVVGQLHGRRHRLIQVAMRIDAARRHHAPGHVDFTQALRQALTDLHDPAVGNPQIRPARVAGGRQHRVPQHQIKTLLRHMRQPV